MADSIVQGLFGASPYDVDQAQNARMFQSADRYAQQAPFERAAGQMYRAGGMLGGAAAQGMGMVNPQVEEARQVQQIMSQIDPNTTEGLTKGALLANRMGNSKLAFLLSKAAQERKAQEQRIALDAAKERREEFKIGQEAEWKREERLMGLENQRLQIEGMLSNKTLDRESQERWKERHDAVLMEIAKVRNGPGDIGKPMTEAQRFKVTQSMNKDKMLVGQVGQDSAFLRNAVSRLKKHPGFNGMTGVQAYLPSAPQTPLTSGDAQAAETILEEIKGRTATLGRIMASAHGKLGNMAVQEWKIVADSLASLNPKSKEFTNQLDNLVAQVNGLEARTKEAFDSQYENYTERGAPKPEGAETGNTWSANTKDDVKMLLQSGQIDRATAKKILQDMDRQGKL